MPTDIEELLDSLRRRWNDLAKAPQYQESFLLHLQSLGSDLTAEVVDSEDVIFPSQISIAFAICRCGVREFIVDGSTQECQNCGSLMFRTDVADYELIKPLPEHSSEATNS